MASLGMLCLPRASSGQGDSLLARFTPNPNAVFRLIEARRPGFLSRRMDAQAALDRIGLSYGLHDLYAA